ncbi:HAMP domain-containing sensor histidine kinase [Bacteriovorax sp. PP10]|uniref:histidine kinase n=1 Tax=Bacteriovorax antarcticus TaxID=3088717 RepID=A0ABU5VSG4_9BACT|nr:HAMP domain-containing sensor histidine kinase [Bacteriovorax sp. PP10]MEA9355987.1 HAMP domain-containing sensor histidine kinase [Bacteriovorax sp. PP10]
MFLKRVKARFSQLSYRLALTYLLFFIPCYLITFGIFYAWTSDFLQTRDRDLIESRMGQYQEIVEREGIVGLKKIYFDTKMRSGSSRYLIQLYDLKGNDLFLHMSEELNKEFSNIDFQLKKSLDLKNDSWFYLESKDHDEDAVEVKTVLLANDLRLNVGASTEERDELLEKFQVIFLTIFIPLLISSIICSILIAQKFLKPISNLSGLIKKIKDGNLSQRAVVPKFKDELHELATAFNDMLSQIEFLIEAMKDTLDNVAHDLRTPIARVRLAAELALKSESPEQLKIAAEESVENLDVILNMIQTIMTMSGLNSKTLQLKKEHFYALHIIEEVVDLYLFVAEEKQITISIECSDSIQVFADRFMIRQALANLIDNAIKYSSTNTHISIVCYEEDQRIIFLIKDQGTGISSDDTPRIWERLYRGDKSRSEKGFGLGLSLVKIFIESNDGNVSLESTSDKGSVFKFSLPND